MSISNLGVIIDVMHVIAGQTIAPNLHSPQILASIYALLVIFVGQFVFPSSQELFLIILTYYYTIKVIGYLKSAKKTEQVLEILSKLVAKKKKKRSINVLFCLRAVIVVVVS